MELLPVEAPKVNGREEGKGKEGFFWQGSKKGTEPCCISSTSCAKAVQTMAAKSRTTFAMKKKAEHNPKKKNFFFIE